MADFCWNVGDSPEVSSTGAPNYPTTRAQNGCWNRQGPRTRYAGSFVLSLSKEQDEAAEQARQQASRPFDLWINLI